MLVDVTTDELAARLGEEGLVVLDVRSEPEYSGAVTAPCDPRPGHVPGARHVDLADLYGARDAEAIRVLIGAPSGTEVIAYCHTGGRSALAVQILWAAGYEARNYVGSWHEWCRDPARPAEVGA